MQGFVRFWRVLLRFFFGFSFILQIILVVSLPEFLNLCNNFLALMSKGTFDTFQSLASSIIILFIFGLLSALGLFLLENIAATFGIFIRLLLRKRILIFILSRKWASRIFLPISMLARKFYEENSEQVLTYYRLKSQANDVAGDHVLIPDSYISKVSEHLSSILNDSLIEHIDYYHSVTQEQAKRDHLGGEVRDIYFFLIVAFTGLAFASSHGLVPIYSTLIIGIMLSAVVIPALMDKRMRLAIYTMLGYIDAFTLGEGASVEDRDAF